MEAYLRIGDVGTVNMQFADVASTSLMNGKPTVSIQVFKLPEEDLIAIAEFCNEYSEEWNETHTDTKLYRNLRFSGNAGSQAELAL